MLVGLLGANHACWARSSVAASALLSAIKNANCQSAATTGVIQRNQPAQLPGVCQQVRTAKMFRLQHQYGVKPLYTDHQYLEAMEDQERANELAFKEVRFALTWETNSPLQDDVVEKYIRLAMLHNGRRDLMNELMHRTMYEIKMVQYKRYMKRRERLATAAAKKAGDESGKQDQKAPASEATGDGEEEEIELNPMVLFHRAIENCKPLVITRKVRRGGATYQVPFPLRASESEYLAMKWLNDTIEERAKPRKRHYYEDLASEIIEAAQGRGKVVKKRDDIHKLAQANKAYAHYRWG